jgi:hypothetical protein
MAGEIGGKGQQVQVLLFGGEGVELLDIELGVGGAAVGGVFFGAWHCGFGASGAFASVTEHCLEAAHVECCRGVAPGMRCQSATSLARAVISNFCYLLSHRNHDQPCLHHSTAQCALHLPPIARVVAEEMFGCLSECDV